MTSFTDYWGPRGQEQTQRFSLLGCSFVSCLAALPTYPQVLAGQDIIQPLVQVAIWRETDIVEHRSAAQDSRHGLKTKWRVSDKRKTDLVGLLTCSWGCQMLIPGLIIMISSWPRLGIRMCVEREDMTLLPSPVNKHAVLDRSPWAIFCHALWFLSHYSWLKLHAFHKRNDTHA